MERNLLILYASQTGYAIETAERIKREARQRRFKAEMMSMDQYSLEKLPSESLIAFVCSVTGQGVEPDTMKSFWRFLLRKDLPRESLKNLKFGVFGQGDSSYLKFNYPAKKLHKRLIQLSATPLVARGDGDDQHYLGVDGALDPWLVEWWRSVLELYPIPKGLEIIPSTILPLNTFDALLLGGPSNDAEYNSYSSLGEFGATVECNTRITDPNHFQDVRHFEFKVDAERNANELYQPGDVFVIYPRNRPEKFQKVIEFFQWESVADSLYQFSVNKELGDVSLPSFLQRPITIRQLLESHLNIFGRPRRYFFELLAFFALDKQHAEKLREFASTEGQNDLYGYAHKMKRTIFEVLQDFSSVKIPLKYLLDLVPFMLPRSFSISSAPSIHSAIHLTVAKVEYKTKLQDSRVGVCTDWMSYLKIGDNVRAHISPGTLRLPKEIETPIICIGPGTGVAPMRSLLMELNERSKGSTRSVLLFGCRSASKDYYYQHDWEAMPGSFKVFTAFSRDQDNKVYVQHKIAENGKELWDLIHEKGSYIYLSGNAKRMPIDVGEALVEVFKRYGGLDQENAVSYLAFLTRVGRYQEECWS